MGAHLTDSIVYGHLWSTGELHEVFDDAGRFQSWLDILAALALAQAQASVGLVPAAAAEAILAHADVSLLDLSAVAEQTQATGHSTLGLIRCLQAVLPEEAREWVYYGATVQDLADTWASIVMRTVGDVLARDLLRLEAAARRLAAEHRDTIMCGRTHGQPGLPITFGFKAAVWASELRRHQDRLAQGRRRWEVVQLGGALGTMQFWGSAAVPLLSAFAGRLGLAAPDIAWITARDRVAEFLGLLAMVTATLGKIGNEVYQLQRPEIGEVSEPFTPGQVGSITMPHKRNPELSEHLGTLARLVRADAAVAVEGMVHEHERDGRAWKAEWLVFPEACMLTGTSLEIGVRLLEGLVVHPERMRANLDAREGYVLSEPVLRVLSAKIGKHAAHAAVHAATMTGIEGGVGFAAAIRADPVVAAGVSEDELAACLDPVAALGATGEFIDRVLGVAPTPPDPPPHPPPDNVPDIGGSAATPPRVVPDTGGSAAPEPRVVPDIGGSAATGPRVVPDIAEGAS